MSGSALVVERDLDVEQRRVLLGAVHVGVAEGAGADRAREGGLDGAARVELDEVGDLVDPQAVETGDQLGYFGRGSALCSVTRAALSG